MVTTAISPPPFTGLASAGLSLPFSNHPPDRQDGTLSKGRPACVMETNV